MLVFIDESGDAGLKLDGGSSPHFVVTLVIFADREEAFKADAHITDLRNKLNLHKNFEFKFNKLRSAYRERFLIELSQFDFQYCSIVINKEKLNGQGFAFPDSFYKYACKLVCRNAKKHLRSATVIIDGSGSREFKMQLANYLKRNVNDRDADFQYIKKVKMQDSHKNNLLQLADMTCGAIARSYKEKLDSQNCRKIIATKEIYVQFWPK